MLNLVSNNSEALQSVMLQAMNTNIDIMLWCKEEEFPGLERLAQLWLQTVEKRFSRFREDSELTHLNLSAGKPTSISTLMLEVLQLAENYYKITGGVFNPLILTALRNAGYNDSFEKIHDRFLSTPVNSNSKTFALILDSEDHTAQLPAGTEMDLGGIVKSWAVKRLVQEYQNMLHIERGFINAGGDLSVWGSSTDSGEPWLIGIENPWQPNQDIGILALESGSVATSSKLGRQWSSPQGQMHHLIDPRTMQPSQSDVVQCTVTGPDVIECEIWTKVICILGLEKGLDRLTQKSSGYETIVFTTQKETYYYGSKASLGKVWQNVPIQHFLYK
ncbi:FAD:protein FMN transferase [Desulfitobacterium sp.]|uniref:FAD:protein FMN transferase n=1 Tax=Desulfitobacterium sp. TaxID=49981 RepID=UPI002B90453C|nr:FAD:protein FMN transferase [Desulfitobacterium sp.]HVJ49859.1 FAD:protein FMN transferase [Desulfitobacterium sp.]